MILASSLASQGLSTPVIMAFLVGVAVGMAVMSVIIFIIEHKDDL